MRLGNPQALSRVLEQACSDKFEQTCVTHPQREPKKGAGGLWPLAPFWEAAEGRLPLWMGTAGLFKLVQASLPKRLGQGLVVAEARVEAG